MPSFVLNGKQGSLNNNGYIVNAGDSLAIKGFRKDKHTEAAFQFANVADSYAANSAQGDVRNTGVIGFAAFYSFSSIYLLYSTR